MSLCTGNGGHGFGGCGMRHAAPMDQEEWRPSCARPSGLVWPVRVGRSSRDPTWRVANGPRYERVASGFYVPADRSRCVEQRIIEGAARLRPDGRTGVVTGWAGLRWRGAAFFDGRLPSGVGELPVELALGGTGARLTPLPGVIVNRRCLLPQDREIVAGLPVAAIQCCVFDEICRRSDLWSAVQVIDMAAAARLISVWLFATYVGACNSRNGAPLARHAVSLAVDESRSPRETWMRLVWLLVAGLPAVLVNEPVYDLGGDLIGVPDLLDVASGLVGEYQGRHHKHREQHRRDVARGERFRDHGLEYFEVVEGDSRAVAAARMHAARGRRGSCHRRCEPGRWSDRRGTRHPRPSMPTSNVAAWSTHSRAAETISCGIVRHVVNLHGSLDVDLMPHYPCVAPGSAPGGTFS